MVYVFTTSDELCSAPFLFRFMTGLWLVAPCSLPTILPSSLSAPETVCTESLACSRNCDLCLSLCARTLCTESLARSRNCDLCLVSSRLVSHRVGSSSRQSLYVSFFSLAIKYVWNTSAPPPSFPQLLYSSFASWGEERKSLSCALC
jgi:hypothetical protein